MSLTYRPDIDVLRAVAVLSIVFFHLQFESFPGGFVGVDIFFVISGYLITRIILDANHSFSLIWFYERRVRRILPALSLVVLATLIAGYLIMLPIDMKRLSESIFSVSTYSSNIYFWMTSGYFGASAHSKPLLHTWSLSVEEQFYVVFPLAVYIWRRFFAEGLAKFLAVVALISLALSIFFPNYDRGDSFFLVHYRIWELLCGSILASLNSLPPRQSTTRTLSAALGCVLLITPVVLYNSETPFPGLTAVVPCLGTMLVIYARVRNEDSFGFVFNNRALVYVGKLSYSLYLWHWPVIVFTRVLPRSRPTFLGEVDSSRDFVCPIGGYVAAD